MFKHETDKYSKFDEQVSMFTIHDAPPKYNKLKLFKQFLFLVHNLSYLTLLCKEFHKLFPLLA